MIIFLKSKFVQNYKFVRELTQVQKSTDGENHYPVDNFSESKFVRNYKFVRELTQAEINGRENPAPTEV